LVRRRRRGDVPMVGTSDCAAGDGVLVFGALADHAPEPQRASGVCAGGSVRGAELVERRNKPSWLLAQPGWLDGVLDTFDWAWWGTRARPPIDMDDLKAG
jgi:hypothetical protein